MPRGPLEPLRTGGCAAICEDFARPEYHAPMQRITRPSQKRCSRKAVEQVEHLGLCKVHARLARQGFVDHDGTVAGRHVQRDYVKQRATLGRAPWFTWLKGALPSNS